MPTYVVTGVNRGLGLEFTRQLSQLPDHTLIATSRSSSSDLSDVRKVASQSTHFLVCDTGDEASIKAFATEAKKVLDGKQIDVLINSAGINYKPDQKSLTIGPEDLYEHIRVNVLGPAKITEFLLAQDLLAPNVRIVNMTSGLGSMHESLRITPRRCAVYSISKAALNSLTVQQSGDLREELGKDCVVMCMDPGWVKTRMGGKGAILEPEESVGGMLKVIYGLQESDNGRFLTYAGKEVLW